MKFSSSDIRHLKWANNFLLIDIRIIYKLYSKGLLKIDCLDWNQNLN